MSVPHVQALPEGWSTQRLGSVVQRTNQRDPTRDPEAEFEYVDVSSVSRESLRITHANRLRGSDAPSRARKAIKQGDVIFATVRPALRRVAVVPSDLDGQVCSTGFCVLRARPDAVDPWFLYFHACSDAFVAGVAAEQKGSSYPAVTDTAVREETISLPPLPEQRAIAHVLRTVQRAKGATEGVIEAARQLKQSLMRHLFTYGPVPVDQVGKVKLEETEIGPVPEGWEIVPLGDLIPEGPQNGLYKHASSYGEGTPIVRIDDYPNEGGVIVGAAKRVALSPSEIDKYGLLPGDLVVNRVNSLSHLGKSAVIGELEEPTVFESNMMRLRVAQDSIVRGFAFRFLTGPVARAQIRGAAKRAVAQSSINQGDVMTLRMPLPPKDEQARISQALDAVDAKAAAMGKRAAALDSLFQSLLHHLMTGKVRVKELDLPEAVESGT